MSYILLARCKTCRHLHCQTVILNKDFGAGYSFPVMMEDAGITTD
jgi:hypothetical protein